MPLQAVAGAGYVAHFLKNFRSPHEDAAADCFGAAGSGRIAFLENQQGQQLSSAWRSGLVGDAFHVVFYHRPQHFVARGVCIGVPASEQHVVQLWTVDDDVFRIINGTFYGTADPSPLNEEFGLDPPRIGHGYLRRRKPVTVEGIVQIHRHSQK